MSISRRTSPRYTGNTPLQNTPDEKMALYKHDTPPLVLIIVIMDLKLCFSDLVAVILDTHVESRP